MSWMQASEPVCDERGPSAVVETLIEPRSRDLGGFSVRRVLPSTARRMVGPFIFFDEMGPAELAAGKGIDVRPHPHIGLETITYLFAGEILHRDSLGTKIPIRPGEVNWMTAGRGIVHSERTATERREQGGRLHGIQAWVALPKAEEETDPDFQHYDESALPRFDHGDVRMHLIAGEAYGKRSPVRVRSPLFYLAAEAPEGGTLTLPEEHEERAAYVVEGSMVVRDERIDAGRMAAFAPGAAGELRLAPKTRLMLLGGTKMSSRHIFWNFVSSSPERIERAKDDWRQRRFPLVPGDEDERIPLPE
jgi:hypothetical protein